MSIEVTQHHGGTQQTVSAHPTIANSEGVLGTAHNPHGAGPLTREVRDTDVVTVAGGYQMTAAQAASRGLLQKTETGYADVSQADARKAIETAAEKANENPTAEADEGGEEGNYLTMEAEDQAAITSLVADLKAHEVNPVAVVGSIVAHPEALDDTISKLAARTGAPRTEVDKAVREAGYKIEQSIGAYLTGRGVNPDAFWAWAFSTSDRAALVAAANQAVFLGRADGFRTLADRFARYGH